MLGGIRITCCAARTMGCPTTAGPGASAELHGPLRTVPFLEELLGSPCCSSKMSRRYSHRAAPSHRPALTFHTFPECVLDVLQSRHDLPVYLQREEQGLSRTSPFTLPTHLQESPFLQHNPLQGTGAPQARTAAVWGSISSISRPESLP